jgi:hypothetical protein
MKRAKRAISLLRVESSLDNFVKESQGQKKEESQNKSIGRNSSEPESSCPREEKSDFDVKDQEEDGNDVKTDVETITSIFEGFETALVGGSLFRIGSCRGKKEGKGQNEGGECKSNEDREKEGKKGGTIKKNEKGHGIKRREE